MADEQNIKNQTDDVQVGEVFVWNMHKSERYHIDGNCIGCGVCAESCPVNAITTTDQRGRTGRSMYAINQAKCIECGTCAFNCPNHAVFDEKNN